MHIEEKTEKNLDGTISHYTYFQANEVNLEELLTELYTNHWHEIMTTYLAGGAVIELFPKKPEKIGMMDGYLTIDTGNWHLHLCIGKHRGNRAKKEDKETLQQQRQATRGAFIHTTNGTCTPESWSLRLWNGKDVQMVNIIFPNPYLTEDLHRQKEADWSKLELWNNTKEKLLSE